MSIGATPSPTMASCPACGAENRNTARFCRSCGGRLPQKPKRRCNSCETENRRGARYCRTCGTQLGDAEIASSPFSAAVEVARAEVPTPEFGDSDVHQRRTWKAHSIAAWRKPRVAVIASGLALACAAGVTFVMLGHPFASHPITQFATRLVRVRSAATASSPDVLGELRRGESIAGTWVTGQDGRTKWLKIKWGPKDDAYVWSRNLSSLPRPGLSMSLPIQPTTVMTSSVRGEPDPTAAVIGTIAAGTVVQVVGTTPDRWAEIDLAGGGVGYVPAEVVQAAPPAGD